MRMFQKYCFEHVLAADLPSSTVVKVMTHLGTFNQGAAGEWRVLTKCWGHKLRPDGGSVLERSGDADMSKSATPSDLGPQKGSFLPRRMVLFGNRIEVSQLQGSESCRRHTAIAASP